MGASKYFVRYILLGLALQVVVIAILKASSLKGMWGSDSPVGSIGLALGILAISLLTLFGYIHAVKRDPQLLADESSPDLAYYLGFALTVGALAISFIVDLFLVRYDPSIRADLVHGSLGQFGAGLVATVLGLAGKIHLNSLQDATEDEPEVLYRDLRANVRVLSDELRDSVDSLRSAFKEASEELARGAEESKTALVSLTETIVAATTTIENTLSRENVEAPVKRFVSELVSLTDSVAVTGPRIEQLAAVAVDTRRSLSALHESVNALDSSVNAGQESLEGLSGTLKEIEGQSKALAPKFAQLVSTTNSLTESQTDLSKSTVQLTKLTSEHADALGTSLPSVQAFQEASGLLAREMSTLASKVSSIDTSVQSIVQASRNAEQVLTKLNAANDALVAQTNSVSAGLQSLGTSLSNLSKETSVVSAGMTEASRNVPEFSSAMGEAKGRISELTESASLASKSLKALDADSRTAGNWITGVANRLMARINDPNRNR